MSKGKKGADVVKTGSAPASARELSADAKLTLECLVRRREGQPVEEIALATGLSAFEVVERVKVSYARLAAQTAEELRTDVELRLDDVLRRLHADLRLAMDQPSRNAIYALILKTEAQRTRLLGLNLPDQVPDVSEDA